MLKSVHQNVKCKFDSYGLWYSHAGKQTRSIDLWIYRSSQSLEKKSIKNKPLWFKLNTSYIHNTCI